jgi:hypothetical protein
VNSLSPVALTPVIDIHSRISPQISEKFETAPKEYLGAWGKMIYEKNLKSKNSCQTPFKASTNNALEQIKHIRVRDIKGVCYTGWYKYSLWQGPSAGSIYTTSVKGTLYNPKWCSYIKRTTTWDYKTIKRLKRCVLPGFVSSWLPPHLQQWSGH